MSERSEYPPGVPCWVQTLQPDPDAARGFYKALLGWEFGADGGVAQVRGRDVAGIDMLPAGGVPAWITYIRVENADDAAQRASDAGGAVLIGTLDASPAGRFAVLADPSGVPFCVWEAGERQGAQLVNEPGTWTMSSLHTPDPDGARRVLRRRCSAGRSSRSRRACPRPGSAATRARRASRSRPTPSR